MTVMGPKPPRLLRKYRPSSRQTRQNCRLRLESRAALSDSRYHLTQPFSSFSLSNGFSSAMRRPSLMYASMLSRPWAIFLIEKEDRRLSILGFSVHIGTGSCFSRCSIKWGPNAVLLLPLRILYSCCISLLVSWRFETGTYFGLCNTRSWFTIKWSCWSGLGSGSGPYCRTFTE